MSRLLRSATKAGFKMNNNPVPTRKTELSNKFGGGSVVGGGITSAGVGSASIRAARTSDVPGYINRNQHITDQIRWENSPRARGMLSASTNSFEGNIITDTRTERLRNTKTENHPQWLQVEDSSTGNLVDDDLVLGEFWARKNKISVYNPSDSWVSKERQISTLHHEASHAADVFPYHWEPPAGIDPKNVHKSMEYGQYLIPEKDIATINSLKIHGSRDPDTAWGRYITDPSEVRARLNEIRTKLLNNKVDIYNEKVTEKDLEKAKNIPAYKNLKDYFGDDGIFEMINKIAVNNNNKDNDKNLA